MEGRKQVGSSSSSSFTSDLFGFKDSNSPSSSKGIFGSLFAPASKVSRIESLRAEEAGQKKQDVNEVWNNKPGTPELQNCMLFGVFYHKENISRSIERENQSIPNKETSSIYHEERVQQPCHLSSSIYYGGQDIYSHPQSSQSFGLHSGSRNDGGEDDSGIASRGNWWQGSLYY